MTRDERFNAVATYFARVADGDSYLEPFCALVARFEAAGLTGHDLAMSIHEYCKHLETRYIQQREPKGYI